MTGLAIAAHAPASGTAGILSFIENYWWLLLIFGGGILEWLGETFDVGVSAVARAGKRRHRRKVERLKLELEIARAAGPSTASGVLAASVAAKPGRCVHRRVRQVRDRNDELVAWLCTGCETQLPSDWAVATEDL